MNKPEEWSTLLPMAEFTHNLATHSITQKIPFSLMMGYEPQAYPPLGKTFLPNLESQLSDLYATQDDAQVAHKVAPHKMKEQVSSKFTPWKVGDKVWLKMTNCCTCSACHGILFPFSFHSPVCRFPPDHVCCTVQARLCHKHCRHVIGLGPYRLSMTSLPFALAAVQGCSYLSFLLCA